MTEAMGMAGKQENFMTAENVAAIRLRGLIKEMDAVARVLSDVKGSEAKQKAKELRGAARIARQWVRELDKLHRAKQP